jgi:hypothetical protein
MIEINDLRHALIGYQLELGRLIGKIAEIESLLGGNKPARQIATVSDKAPTKRVLSPAARKRIAAAQKKRWAEFHKQKGTAPAKEAAQKKAGSKKKMSADRKAALVANLAKARAARAAKRNSGEAVPF